MPGNTVGIWCGASISPHPPGILVSVAGGIPCRGLLLDGVTGIPGGDAGGTSVSHHIQRGGGHSGPTLVIGDGRASGQVERARTGGTKPKHPLLHG